MQKINEKIVINCFVKYFFLVEDIGNKISYHYLLHTYVKILDIMKY